MPALLSSTLNTLVTKLWDGDMCGLYTTFPSYKIENLQQKFLGQNFPLKVLVVVLTSALVPLPPLQNMANLSKRIGVRGGLHACYIFTSSQFQVGLREETVLAPPVSCDLKP